MNETLSALIAFVGFLIVFSMLVQSVQEALKNLFKLKAGVWERFFLAVYKNDFQMEEILPETPFWERVRTKPFVGEFEQRLKRLKTIILKSDAAFKKIKKTLIEVTTLDISKPESQKTFLSRIEPLCEQLNQITDLKIESMLELYDKNKKGIINDLSEELKTFSSVCEVAEDISPMDIQPVCKKMLTTIRKLEAKISAYRIQIENKSDAWLVQLEGEYKKNMLKWTLIISLFSVVLLNADTFSVYQYFSVNSKAQELMVSNAASAVAEINRLRAHDLNDIGTAIKNDEIKKARDEILAVSKQLINEFKTLADKRHTSIAEAIFNDTSAVEPNNQGDIPALKEQHGKLISLYVSLQKESINFQLEGLSSTGLPLGWRNDWKAYRDAECTESQILVVKKICGLVLTIFLVSFGAPFWQNIMNALIGLKSIYRKPG